MQTLQGGNTSLIMGRLLVGNTDITNYVVSVEQLTNDSYTTKSVGSAVGRAIIGGVLLGGVGLLAGATAKNKIVQNSIFRITYVTVFENATIIVKAETQEEFEKILLLPVVSEEKARETLTIDKERKRSRRKIKLSQQRLDGEKQETIMTHLI